MVNQDNSSQKMSETDLLNDKNLERVAQYLKDVQQSHKRSIPPLEQWQPKHCGKMDLLIKANGEWWHQGQLIKRQSLLDLFSKILFKADGHFYLKTPVEQLEIEVEDEPLLINQVEQICINSVDYIQLTTTNQDIIIVNEQHPIFMRQYKDQWRPYVHVRFGINALIQRAAFYHLVALGILCENAQGEPILQLKSGNLDLQLTS